MTMKEHIEDGGIRKDAPVLFGLSKQDPFLVEDGFFERFPHEVQALASKPVRGPLFIWLRRAAVALPAMALVLFAVHALRSPEVSPVAAPITEETLLSTAMDQFDTRTLLAGITEEEWPAFDSVTVQLTPNEALAYVDQHDIDITEYLYQQ